MDGRTNIPFVDDDHEGDSAETNEERHRKRSLIDRRNQRALAVRIPIVEMYK